MLQFLSLIGIGCNGQKKGIKLSNTLIEARLITIADISNVMSVGRAGCI